MDTPITDKNAFVSELLSRLRNRLAALGESEKAFASRLGSSEALFKNLAKGSLPSADRLAVLLAEIGEGLWIGNPPPETEIVEHITLDGADFARIPVHDARLSAGPGHLNEDAAIIDHMAFRHDWLRKIDVKPENALIARISGDSMTPAIQPGDLVMIDRTRQDVPAWKKTRLANQLPIFAFKQDDQARVKRLERRPKEKLLILYSDNPIIPPEVLAGSDVHSLEILGQVVWSGHVWR